MRDFDSASSTAADSASLALVQFVQMDFDSGTLRLCTGGNGYTWGGHTWQPAYNIGSIDEVQESSTLAIYPLRLTLSGVDPANVSIALDEPVQGRRVRVYLGYLDDGHQLLADPRLIWSGHMDTMAISLGAEAVITVSAQSKMADWERARVRRYTDADQKSDYPADRGLEFVAETAEKELIWGTF